MTKVMLLFTIVLVFTQVPTGRIAVAAEGPRSDSATINLMPMPASLKMQDGRLAITPQFKVALTGQPDRRLEQYTRRMIARLQDRIAVRIDGGIGSDTAGAALVIESQAAAPSVPSLDTDESYSLDVSTNQAVLKAPTSVGAMR
ncbi:MAG TPA: hypothetical protein VEZ90_08655, partial [Blastocatellia bacterium]|nr:hypothetical protein [Blastocatellia bacterium]